MATKIKDPKAYRLPSNVLPRRYDIDIDARLKREEFYGKVSIQVDVQKETKSIELHAKELELTEARLHLGGETLDGEIEQDEEREMAEIKFDRKLPEGPATLDIVFNGHISPSLEGLYKAKDGPEECLCTQCEETDARKIFPCWDEPAFKAQFAWRVTTSPDAVVLANGPLIGVQESEDGKSKTWSFQPTKVMSSYLVALVIGDVAGTEEETVDGTPIRVWALRGKEQMGEFAHRMTARMLPWYEDYFQAPYHFDKYDQVAVPGFAAGAMENSGLVLFRQTALIMDPQTASWNAERYIAHVVAHEFAHMWFGNLVTMEWWDDLWLNEAFAEWISHKILHALAPEYDVWLSFQDGKNSALVSDALESTHPIYSKVETPAQAAELFDVITYQKGCSVLRMIENYLGEEAFRNGLRTYMKEFAEDNAAGADLWRHLAGASGQPVTEVMESWIGQGGYPLLDVAVQASGSSTTLRLAQRRFFSDPNAKGKKKQTWQVPIALRYEDTAGEHRAQFLMTEREMEVPLAVEGELEWLYANGEELGFYRQNIDDGTLGKLLVNLDALQPLEQIGLLSDQWALVRNGTRRISQFLDVLSAMVKSTHYAVVENVVGRLHGVEELLQEAGDEPALAKFRVWVSEAYRAQLEELGWEPVEGESQNNRQRRASVIDAMALLAENEEAGRLAAEWADREAKDPSKVSGDLAGLFVAAAAWHGDDERFGRYVKVYEKRKKAGASPQETSRYLNSLAMFRKPELVEHTFGLMGDGTVPQEAIGVVLRQMFRLRHAQVHAWEYMKGNWPTILNLGSMWLGRMVESSGELPPKYRKELVKFYDRELKGEAQISYARALETMDQMAEFVERTRDDLVGWFQSR